MKIFKFRNGDEMHAIGLGTWKAQGEKLKKAVKDAIYAGYRHIDTAANYENEEVIGEALSEIFAEGRIFREDLFITSKLWNDSHAEGQVIPALEESLGKLKLDYLNLYLIHWPVAFRYGVKFPKTPDDYLTLEEAPLLETWKQMEKAKELGLTKHIGVSNFSIKKLENLIAHSDVVPEMNQVEMHPLLPQNELLVFCKKNEILMTAYSPLGSGDRAKSMKAGDEPNLLDLDVIRNIAKKHNTLPAQVLISWHTKRGCAAIPKSVTKEHLITNFQAADVELDENDMKAISEINERYRYINGKFFDEPTKGYTNLFDL